MYTLLKNIEKKKASYVDNLLLSISGMVFTVKQGPQKKQRKKSVNLHLELINKVDKLIKEHNSDSFSIKSNLNQEMQVSDNNQTIEKRPGLKRKINLSEIKVKQHNDSLPVGTIIEEIDPEISFANNHGSKFVANPEITNNFQPMNGSLDARTEIIDLSSFSDENINSHANNSFINDGKKIDVINTKEFVEKKSGEETKMTLKSPEKSNDKGQANYMKNSGLKEENKTKESGYKDSNNTSDFENTLKALDEKEKELKRKKQELLKKEKEAKKLRKLEAKKMKLEEREKAKAALKAKKEMEIIKKRQEKELKKKAQEEERLKKLELQVLAAEKIKKEREAFSTEQQKEEEQQQLEKIKVEKTTIASKEEEFEKKEESTLLDDDIKKLLIITNNLLGELPDEVIDKFVESEDFELYSKVLQKYKIK
jgi:hypothetical protein